jgi:hypothetical protein
MRSPSTRLCERPGERVAGHQDGTPSLPSRTPPLPLQSRTGSHPSATPPFFFSRATGRTAKPRSGHGDPVALEHVVELLVEAGEGVRQSLARYAKHLDKPPLLLVVAALPGERQTPHPALADLKRGVHEGGVHPPQQLRVGGAVGVPFGVAPAVLLRDSGYARVDRTDAARVLLVSGVWRSRTSTAFRASVPGAS